MQEKVRILVQEQCKKQRKFARGSKLFHKNACQGNKLNGFMRMPVKKANLTVL